MGFLDKLKGKPAAQPVQPEQNEPEEEDSQSRYEPTDWQFYYRMPDNWGGIEWSNVDEFMFRYLSIEQAQQLGTVDQYLSRFGYSGLPEWTHVVCTFFRHHFGAQGQIPADDVNIDMYSNPQWAQAATNASMRQIQDAQQQALAGDPTLNAPFEGVTIEQWAAVAARMAMVGNDANAMARLLAEYQMDRAKYDRVAAEFMARMQRDMTGAISTIYGNAFMEAQSSQGMWGPQSGGTPGGADGGAGGEPISFERYCEISGAMSAWAEQGGDVNGMLTQVFGLTTMQWVNVGGYWSQKMMTDMDLMGRMGDLTEQYKQKYSAGDPDADLDVI